MLAWEPLGWWRCGAEATAKPARATPSTRAMAITTAIGATGMRRVVADRQCGAAAAGGAGGGLSARACAPGAMDSDLVTGLVSEGVPPYQARALTTPTS